MRDHAGKVLASVIIWAVVLMSVPVFGGEKRVPVIFSGGHETDPRDGGRPVVLVAAGLGVKPEVFREAFRGVTPARDGRPSPEAARRNKEALLSVLEPYGITNDRLDEVSDYYRYRPGGGRLWRNTPAKAYAVVENDRVKKIVVTERGSGYSSRPRAVVQGMETVALKVTIQFGQDLERNGSVRSVVVTTAEESR